MLLRVAHKLSINSIIRIFLQSVLQLRVTDDVSSSPILVTLTMEAIRSSETLALTTETLRNIKETEFFTVIAVETSNLTKEHLLVTKVRDMR
jgi:ABC-type uncharacterized transport system substrate-binding protein